MQQAKQPFNVMIKPRGPICNLACEYCYYLPKQDLYPQSEFKMTLELLSDFTRQMIAAQPGNTVAFTWQGGEPTLMGLDFFKQAVCLQQAYAPPGMRVSNALQTNGTTLNPAWCRFFKEHDFLIGLSVDGPPSIHNAFRYNKSGRGKFKAVMRGANLLQQHNVDFNILCCVHQANVEHPIEVYRFLRDSLGARFIQFIPIIQRELNDKGRETEVITDRSVDGKEYGEFLQAIFDVWIKEDVGRVFVQLFDLALGAWHGQPGSLCVFSETCGRALVLEHNGDLYSCDHFVNSDNFLGNITETPLSTLVESQQQIAFGKAKKETLPQTCLDCDVRFVCNGGCPKNRDEHGSNILCDGYQTFFHHIDPHMRIMSRLLDSKRAPAEIMHMEIN